jgi:hypothetical protein
MFHGENVTPRPNNIDSQKYDNLMFHVKVLNCHLGTVFYFTLPGFDLVNARRSFRLCVLCGLRHPTYSVDACLVWIVEARDAASRAFLRRDIWNADQVERFKQEEREKELESGPASDTLLEPDHSMLEQPSTITSTERDIYRLAADSLLATRARDLKADEREIEDEEKDLLVRRRELELYANHVRIKRTTHARDKERLVKAYQCYEDRVGEGKGDETRMGVLMEMLEEVEDLCTTHF